MTDDKTLSDHCRTYYASRGIKYPTVDTDLNKELYIAYINDAFKEFKGVKE
jgi:hypothetical protein